MAALALAPQVAPEQPTLSKEAVVALEDLVKGCQKDNPSGRRGEVRRASYQRHMVDGDQHIWWDSRSHVYMRDTASGQQLDRFREDYNICKPHYRSFVSVLSQSPPGVNFPPKDLQAPADVAAAAHAEKMRTLVDQIVHMKDVQGEISGNFCTDGRTITWAYVDEQGELRCRVFGVLETKIPLYVRDFKQWGYAGISEEIDLYEAKYEWSDYADEISASDAGGSEASYEQIARLGVLSSSRNAGYSDAIKSVVTKHVFWIKPSRFQKAEKSAQAELKQFFPNGVRVTMIGSICVDAIPERMEDVLSVAWPSPGKGQERPSLLKDVMPIQEAYNDYKNMLREQAGYVNPATWVHGDAVDPEALTEQSAEPGAIHVITPPNGMTVDNCVMVETSIPLSAEIIQQCDVLLSDSDRISGDVPALQGLQDDNEQTYSGQKLLTDQAKGQLSTAYGALQWLMANTYEKLIRLAAQMFAEKGEVAIQGQSQQDAVNPQNILNGNWGCYPDTDSSFPETTADKRAALQMVLGQLAQVDPTLVMHPDNLKLVKQYGGVSDLIIPGAEARDKQLREIERLLQEGPIPDQSTPGGQAYIQQAQMAGQMGQQPPPPDPSILTSSVAIDPDWDFHQPELDKVQEWLSSNARYDQERRGNFPGIENIKLHGAAHRKILAQQAQQAAAAKREPMKLAANFADLDSATKTQALQNDGYQPNTTEYEVGSLQDQQGKAAETQNKAADATHKAVLAARESVPEPPPKIESSQKKEK